MAVNMSGNKNKSNAPAQAAVSAPAWMLKGKSAQAAMQEADAKAEIAKSEASKLFRFWLNDGEEAAITFLDGNLDQDGMLEGLTFYEHTIQFAGKWQNFICTNSGTSQSQEPCPICEGGDQPALVTAFTIIDHRTYQGKSKNGEPGKVYKDTKKLLLATRTSFKVLQKLASKLGGLAGQTFEVSRSDSQKPRIGDVWVPVQKRSMKDLSAQFGEEAVALPDYAHELTYRTRAELLKMGIGKATATIGASDVAGDANLSDNL